MKVFVCTKTKAFCEETYIGVKASKKAAEKFLRERYPYMKPDGDNCYISYVSSSEPLIHLLLFIHEEGI